MLAKSIVSALGTSLMAAGVVVAGVAVSGPAAGVSGAAVPALDPPPGSTILQNNRLQEQCGLDMTLILDASGSIESSGAVNTVRAAGKSFLRVLADTDSTARVSQFATVNQELTARENITAQSVTTGGVLDTAMGRYYNPRPPTSGYSVYEYDGSGSPDNSRNWRRGSSTKFTNWDAALDAAGREQVTDPQKLAVFITDGDPTAYNLDERGDPFRSPTTVGYNTFRGSARDRTVQRAIDEANQLKREGWRVLVVGVGTAVTQPSSNSAQRLGFISGGTNGPVQFVTDGNLGSIQSINDVDVALVRDFKNLTEALGNLVRAQCAPSVTVTKKVDAGYGLGQFTPAAGWDVAATVTEKNSNSDFTWTTPAGATGGTATGTTAASGSVQFQWKPSTPNSSPPPDYAVRIEETVKAGYEAGLPSTRGALEYVCLIKSPGTSIPDVEVSGPLDAQNGFELPDVAFQKIVTCDIFNEPPKATLIVKKKAVAPDGTAFPFSASGPGVSGSEQTFSLVPDVQQPTVEKSIEVSPAIGGSTYRISEAVPNSWVLQDLTCDAGNPRPSGATVAVDIKPGDTVTCTYTNTPEPYRLTLQKQWQDSFPGDTSELTITGGSGGSPTAVATAPNGATATSNVPARSIVNVAEVLGAANTGSYDRRLSCTAGVTPAADGSFQMPAEPVTCTFTNTRKAPQVSLAKTWVDAVAGDEARLTISGGGTPDASATSVAGQPAVIALKRAQSGEEVRVSEVLAQANTGSYTSGNPVCRAGGTDVPVTNGRFTMPAEDVACSITNTRTTPRVTLEKTWRNAVDGDRAEIRISGGGTPDASATSVAGQPAVIAVKRVQSGDVVTVSEVLGQANTGSYTSGSPVCRAGGTDVPVTNGRFTMPDAAVACEIVNTRSRNTLTLRKEWVNGLQGDSADLKITGGSGGVPSNTSTATGAAGSEIDTTNQATRDVASGDTVDVTETLVGANKGSYTTVTACDSGVVPDDKGEFTMPDTDVTCTVTNTRTDHSVTLRKDWLNAVDGDTAALTITGGETSPAQGSATAPGNLQPASTRAFSGATVTVAEVLGTSNTGGYDSALRCIGATADGQGTFTMPDRDVVCTFENTRTENTLTLQKTWIDARAGDTADLEITGGTGGTPTAMSTASGASGSETDTANVATRDVRSGATVSVGEVVLGSGSYDSAWRCVDGQGSEVASGTGRSGSFPMPDEPVTCTYTNTRTVHTVTLDKSWGAANAGDTFTMEVTAEGQTATSPAVAPDGLATPLAVQVRSGEQVRISETADPNNQLTYSSALRCPGVSPDAQGQFTMPAADVACVVTNSTSKFTVRLEKVWRDAVANDKTELRITGAPSTPATSTASGTPGEELDTVNVAVAPEVASGATVRLSEVLDPANGAAYDGRLSCDVVTPNAAGEITVTNSDVVCRFTNLRSTAFVSLDKEWVDAIDGDQSALEIRSGADRATATSTAPDTADATNTAVLEVQSGETVSVLENITGGGAYDRTLACFSQGRPFSVDGQTGSFTMPGAAVECTWTNRRSTHDVTLSKAWVNPADGDTARLRISGGDPDPAEVVATAPNTDSVTTTALVGDQIRVEEILPGTNRGTYTREIRCTEVPGGGDVPVANDEFTMPDAAVQCEYTNTRTEHAVTLQKRWVDPVTDDTATLRISAGGSAQSAASVAPAKPDDQNSARLNVGSGEPVTVEELLGGVPPSAPNAGTYEPQLTCSSGVVPTQATPTSGTFTMPDEPVTCRFVNTRTEHKLTLRKQWENAVSGDKADLVIDGGVTDPVEKRSVAPDTTTLDVPARSGARVRVSDSMLASNTGRYDVKLVCDGGVSPDANGNFTMPNVDVECVYTNSRSPQRVTLAKTWVDAVDGHTADLSITPDGGSAATAQSTAPQAPAAGNTASASVVAGTKVTVSEAVTRADEYGTTLVCEDAQGTVVAQADAQQAEFTVPDQAVDCMFTNTRTRHTVTLQKRWVNAADGDTARLRITGGLTDPAQETSTAPDVPVSGNSASTEAFVGAQISVLENLPAANRGSYTATVKCEGFPEGQDRFEMPDRDVTCTYTNTRTERKLTLRKQWVDAVTGDVATLEIVGGETDPATARSTAPAIPSDQNSASTLVRSGRTVAVDERLPGSNAGQYRQSSPSCETVPPSGGGQPVTITPNDRGEFTMPDVEVVCTFTNTLERGELVITKVFDPKDSGFARKFEITYDCVGSADDGSVFLNGSPSGESAPAIDVPVGPCVIYEPNLPPPPATWEFAAPVFDPADRRVEVVSGQAVEVRVDNEINRRTAQLLLVKQVDGGSSSAADWTLTADSPITPAKNYSEPGDNTAFREVYAGVPYVLAEAPAAGQQDYTRGEWVCESDGLPVDVVAGDEVTVPPGTKVTCTVVNARDVARLKLVKKVEGRADPDSWELTATSGDPSAPVVKNRGGSGDFTTVWSGVSYTLTESGPGNYTAGAWTCESEDDGQVAPAAEGSATAGPGDPLTIVLRKGQTVTCTIVNVRDTAQLKLVKQVEGKGAPDNWTLTARAKVPEDDKNVSTPGGSGAFETVYSGIEYTLGESGPGGYSTSDWTCVEDGAPGGPGVNTGATLTLDKGQKVVCTIVNSRDLGSLTITKEFNPRKSGFTGPFDITYSCVDSGDPVGSGTVSLRAGESTTIGGLPTGTVCTVSEPRLPKPPSGWRFDGPVLSPVDGAVTITQRGENVSVLVTNTVSKTSRQACPVKVKLVKPKPKKAGNRLLVKKVKTSKKCKIVKPVVICRPLASATAGEKAFCKTKVTKRGRVRVRVAGYDRVRVTVIVRAKPKKAFRSDWKPRTWRKSWILR